MVMTDPIADMLTRIRNANSVHHDKVEIPGSKIKVDRRQRQMCIRDRLIRKKLFPVSNVFLSPA